MASIVGKYMDQRPSSRSSDWSVEVEDVEDDAVSVTFKLKPKEKYPAKLHAKSVAERLGVKRGLIYLEGLPALNYEDSDQPAHFRQRRYFYYLSGINFPGCIITYNIHTDRLMAWIPAPNSGSSVIFNGSNPTRKDVQANYEFDQVHHIENLYGYIKKFGEYEPGSTIYTLHSGVARPLVLQKVISPDGTSRRVEASPFDSTHLQPAMDAARVIKSPYEIKMIQKASAITAQAHINVLRGIKNLKNEAEIEAIFAATCISEKAKEQSYGIIAASGPNASTLHYVANNEPLKGRQLVCLDAGVEWECYASDVTRTFPISGKFTPEAKSIYDIVAKMQEECIAMVGPKVDFRNIHIHAHKVAIEGLMKLGLLQNGSYEELFLSRASVVFFPHGLGHYMGLEVHDVGDGGNLLLGVQGRSVDWAAAYFEMIFDPRPTAASILAPNMVITVEPGIYFSRYALEEVYLKDDRFAKYINKDLLEKYYPVGGVRIEDDILVTNDGYENLTTAPKGEEALKIINGEEEEKEKRGWFW